MKQVYVYQVSVTDKNKQGEELRSSKGTKYWKVGLNVGAEKENATTHWCNSLVFDEVILNKLTSLTDGTLIEGEFGKDDYGLNFKPESIKVVGEQPTQPEQNVQSPQNNEVLNEVLNRLATLETKVAYLESKLTSREVSVEELAAEFGGKVVSQTPMPQPGSATVSSPVNPDDESKGTVGSGPNGEVLVSDIPFN